MKKSIFLILIFSFSILQVQGFAQQSLFDEANSLLEEGSYQQAIEKYLSIAGEGHKSGALWQNLGVAYTRLDSLGKAKYYFLQARKFNETERQARQALEYVNNRFPHQSAVLPPLPWVRFIRFLSDGIGLETIIFAALFFLYAGISLKIGSWFKIDMKKILSYTGYGAIAVSGILFFCSFIIHYQESRYSTGVMVHREVSVYQQPEVESGVVSTAYEGYTMQVDEQESDEQPNWKYVRLENGMYGWIQDDHVLTF